MSKLSFSADITPAKEKLQVTSNRSGWIVIGYEGNSSNLVLQGQGNSYVIEDFVPLLKDDQVQYVLMRLPANPDGGDDMSTKDVLMVWIGPGVGRVQRGKRKGDFGEVSQHLQPHHVDLEAINKANITSPVVWSKVFGAGSHVID
eukprot:TRINITY_DN8499_c0_g1_i1.p1 TRINITY_DN8499_c0_g1~~TRINITY_DN8499_c0_g1_i1.p1  ORF type:complete len:145 (-),score=42.33 TRINITY_DN8499_c0_g1_i1:68-502(-)